MTLFHVCCYVSSPHTCVQQPPRSVIHSPAHAHIHYKCGCVCLVFVHVFVCRVSAMCIEWEAVLTHAVKKPKPKNSLRLTGRQEAVSLWPLARLSVSVEDLQRFSRLEHVHNEVGRGRAWLRAAINERTLETYLHIILGQEAELQ